GRAHSPVNGSLPPPGLPARRTFTPDRFVRCERSPGQRPGIPSNLRGRKGLRDIDSRPRIYWYLEVTVQQPRRSAPAASVTRRFRVGFGAPRVLPCPKTALALLALSLA